MVYFLVKHFWSSFFFHHH